MLPIIKKSYLWLTISGTLIAASLVLLFTVGLNLSADFIPGTMFQLTFKNTPDTTAISNLLGQDVKSYFTTENANSTEGEAPYSDIGAPEIRTLSDGSIMIRTLRLNSASQAYILDQLETKFGEYDSNEIRNVSPTFAEVFKQHALWAVGIATIAIVIYIAYAFRKVPRQVSPWKFGLCAIIALLHDVTIIVGFFALFGYLFNVEVNSLFITAILTIMGFSVHDTIVVFDRIRENLKGMTRNQTFADVAEISVNQTIARSINTSLSTLITLLALAVLGSESIRWFVIALILGIIVGTYSSIFIASPLLTLWQKKR